ncbi:methyltransferase domain-containing protein [Streptomyces rapamycinicus]|uniref:Ubiquinone biosynthesis protein UbiE n=2 Tax=Streptomyces rapamycinicus TaxID=1226757 RepID=A0A0A0NCH3_STRRN|nr:methyltransferase domain-containing protein [Streptomyces rapamycinicus]AGP54926.1 ubiquinone biosynthesis protein UbiE [Streptomyces rapamycinicus NRRL 5491]MBB4782449.1 ubiquinone/menaquinone biosynthesis C-methylase UbiE [Streptomyces rapamycinicus]RLV82067.1 ubiquinone biosynthesis protein UbiE [Streptomyces rapamycinicus NRRL 5491]UTO62958.1 methyltransferase domain-containing protein [Streptomyces rapamycinicus]UTP30916.1 methyltransferase domain-containing protein [Streptomyces rapam
MTSPASSVFETTRPASADYLTRFAASDAGRDYKGRMLDALDLRAGLAVLDAGCGPGADLPALAEAVVPGGTVIGVDRDQEMLDAAAERVAAAHPCVELRLGDVHALPLDDVAVDRARTDRVLQWVDDPARALAEFHRVLRPGGRLVMGEPDWDTLVVDHPDPALSRAYTRHITERVIRNATIGRRLARLATDAGFRVPEVVPATQVFRDARVADRVFGFERTTRRAVEAGDLTEDQAAEWLHHLAHGPFFASATLYVVVAEA